MKLESAKRTCEECGKEHSHVVSSPCDRCKGTLCFKCCHERQLVREAMN